MPMPAFVAVSILVLSCIFSLTTTTKALDSRATSGGIEFSYHRNYLTASLSASLSIMTLAPNDGSQSKATKHSKKKAPKIVTPEAREEKKQERLKKQRESLASRREAKKGQVALANVFTLRPRTNQSNALSHTLCRHGIWTSPLACPYTRYTIIRSIVASVDHEWIYCSFLRAKLGRLFDPQ